MNTATIEQLYRDGRLLRGAWSGTDADGRETLCLWTALMSDRDARPATCPVDECPVWLAYVIPLIDDAPTSDGIDGGPVWRRRVERVIGIAPHLHLLVGKRGDRLRSRWLAVVVREARSHTTDTDVLGACDAVLALLDKHGAGGRVTRKQWGDAAEAALAASWRASNPGAARRAASSAAPAARVALASASSAAPAARAVLASAAASAAVEAAAAWAKAAACDRVIDALLTMIEQEVAA